MRRQRAFTVIELVMVLVLAGLLAAVAAPRVLNQQAFQTHASAADVRAALRYARKLAVTKNRDVCVGITATSVALSLNPLAIPGGACTQAVLRPGAGDPYVVNPPPGIGILPAMGFRFDAQGRPNPNVPINLTVGGSAPIVVARETGRVQ